MSESDWIERAQSAEARLNTLNQQIDRIKEDSVFILNTFAARKKSDGSFDIDFKKFIANIGSESAAEIRQIIDKQYPKESKKLKSVK